VAVAAAATVLLAATILLTRPHPADAAGLLRAAQSAGIRVATSHSVAITRDPRGPRRVESWYVRGRGKRDEVRAGEELIGVVVRGTRWEFRWDVASRYVAAWSTEMNGEQRAFEGLVQDG
jgi:hypothetical protein